MAAENYIKTIINLPDKELFGILQHTILYEDVEMFYFPHLSEIDKFCQRIHPHILVTYIDPKTLATDRPLKLFQSSAFNNIWLIFIISKKVGISQMRKWGEFNKALFFYENTNQDVIVNNIRSLLKSEKEEQKKQAGRQYTANQLEASQIITRESSVEAIFEKLINFLPKILPYDYWALFTFDLEYNKVTNFVQFVPPHKRNIPIMTPNLEKLAESWLKKHERFQVSISEDSQLFKKLGEWGWGTKQLYFSPLLLDDIPMGGLIIGNMSMAEMAKSDLHFLQEISKILSRKIYNIFSQKKGDGASDDFAEQLIHNRFSEDSILQLSCKKITEIARAENTVFWQINRGFGFLFPKFSYARESQTHWQSLEKNMLFLSKDQNLNHLISGEKIFRVAGVGHNGQFDEATTKIFQKLGYHNLLLAPVRIENEEIGVFIANRSENERRFSAWEVDRVTNLMNKIQKVLEDAHIVKEANLKLKQLSRIFELGNEIKLDLNLEDILARITRSIRKTLGWNDVAVLRSDHFKKTYKPVSTVGFDKKGGLPLNVFNQVNFKNFDKFLTNCKKVSHSYFYDSHPVHVDGSGAGFLDEIITEWHDQDLLIIPIETRQKLLGYLIVRDPVDRLKPAEDKVISLEYFANQAAVALENSILYENLLASEERYRSLAETMTLGLVTCSPDGKIVYVNPAFSRLVGLKQKALSKKPLASFFSGESLGKFQQITKNIMENTDHERDTVENVELELLSTGGENIPVSTFAFPFYQQRQKIGLFLVLNDLRVVKKLERLKADFNSMIVHDLRSPMNVIQGFIELIRTRVVGEINAEQEELLDIAKENVKKVLTLIDNFLVASKIEVGRFGIEPKVGELNASIERIVENHRVLLKNKNIALDTSLNKNLPLLYFDSFRIEQVVNNLLSNAIKFTPEEGKIWRTTDFYQEEIKGEKKMFAKIGTHDTGPGIPPQKLKYVFEKYEQVDSESSKKSAGTGLGLSICKEIVNLHGGEIWIESEVKKGSHFYFTLPIEPSIDKFLK